MSKIIIIGNGGTGKSTLGDLLSKATGIKVFHLDKLTYKPGWIRVDEQDFKNKLDKILSEDKWIVEGWSFHSTLETRLNAADTIIYLKFPVTVCYFYALQRHVKYAFRQNPYDPEDSPIINKTGKMIKAMWKVYRIYEKDLNIMLNELRNKKIIIFKNRKEVNKFIETEKKITADSQTF